MKLTKHVCSKFFLFTILLVIFNGCTDESEGPLINSGNLRVKSFSFQTDRMDVPEEVLLTYDTQDRLHKVITSTDETIFSYNEDNQLLNDQARQYYYNDFGKIHKILSNDGRDSTLILYNEDHLVISEIIYALPYKVITETMYNSENKVIETNSYIDLNDQQFRSAYRSYYEYQDDEIIKVTTDNYDEDGNFIIKSQTRYTYTESPTPIQLLLKSLNIKDSNAFYQVTNTFLQGKIPLGVYASSGRYPFYNYQQIKSENDDSFNFNEEYIYTFGKYTYPEYTKRIYTDTFNRANSWEFTWSYEEF